MAPETTSRLPRLVTAALTVLAFAAAAWVAWTKQWSIDEFQYLHAGWLVAQGQVPYRDFFECHFPLVYQVLALPFWALDPGPAEVQVLRVTLLPFLALSAAAARRLMPGEDGLGGWLAPLLLLVCAPFVRFATEVRPDALACAFALAAFAAAAWQTHDRRRGWVAGAAVALAVWGSQKAAVVVAPVLLGWAVDSVRALRGRSGRMVGAPSAFLGGASLVGLFAVSSLVLNAAWGDFWRWTVVWAAEHQEHYPGFSWQAFFLPEVWQPNAPLLLAGVVGWVLSAARLSKSTWLDGPELLTLLLPITAFISFALQRAPFPYSFLPFLAATCVFAARTAGAAWKAGRGTRALAAVGIAGWLVHSGLGLAPLMAHDNEAQLRTLRALAEVTEPTDAVYDNSGAATARPHVSYFFYTDALLRKSLASHLTEEVPRRIRETGCTVLLRDLRFDGLPVPLKAFLRSRFLPYSPDLWLWGQRFEPAGRAVETEFEAVRAGRYFFEPAEAWRSAALTVNGQRVKSAVLTLPRGRHRLRYDGARAPFHLLWLPRNGETWRPARGAPRFSVLF